jgi:DivIVA domain-containing protein
MSADMIESRRFGQSWRGYDPDEVKPFLAQVAAQVRALKERCESEGSARREAEERAAHPQMDEATLMAAVGEETAGILRSAHSAAAEIAARAETNAQTVVGTAQTKADDLVTRAESLLAARTAEAEAAAAEIRESALAEAEQLREAARRDADALAARASSEYQETVQAAHALREKILSDLARRRKLGSVQIEQLRAGRERLLDAYVVVRRTLDDVTDELQRADAEARAAADAVGRQNAADRPDEPVDLRHDEAWDALSAFSDPKSPAPDKPSLGGPPAPGEAVVMAPRATDLATAAAFGPAAPPPGPPPAINLLPAPPVPNHQGKAAAEAARATNGGTARSIVDPEDAIESVRILRQEEAPSGPPIGPDEAPGAPVGRGGAGADDSADDGADGEGAGGDGGGTDRAPADLETGGQPDVQGLFARIRASRAEATTTARKTLYHQDTLEPSGTRTVTEGGAEAVVSAVAASVSGPVTEGGTAGEAADLGPTSEEAGPGPASEEETTDQEFFRRRDAVTRRLESSLARKLKRALQDEQNSLLDRLRNLKAPAAPANILPNVEEHPDRFVEAGRPLLEEAARAGADLVAALWGGTVPPDLAREGIEDLAEELGKAIAEPLRQRLELAFQSADEDNGELADVLGAAYREWKTQRIEAAAHDEVAAAFSRGAYLAFAAGTPLHWVADASGTACPDCEDNALAGEQAKAEPWPTGQLYPPAHPGCRCALAPDLAVPTGRARPGLDASRPAPAAAMGR